MKRKSAKAKAEALRLRDGGMSCADISAQIKKRFREDVSIACIRRWVDLRDAAPTVPVDEFAAHALAQVHVPDPRESDDAEPAAEPAADGAELSSLDEYRALVREAKQTAAWAKRDGNPKAAQAALRDALTAQNNIARIEALQQKTAPGVLMTEETIAAGFAECEELVLKLVADLERTGGLTCSHCGRAVRVSIAKGETK